MTKRAEGFFIKPSYVARGASDYFEDNLVKDGVVHQPDVYALVSYLGRKFGCTHILDIGCGGGHKLTKLHPEFSLIGVDFGVNIDYCRSHYPFGEWVSLNLETPHHSLLPSNILKNTIIVCSDVIEHLTDPTGLLTTLKCCLEHAPIAILTTPERDLARGVDSMGPPENPAHVREWNRSEFTHLLNSYTFEVAFLGLTFNNDRDFEKKTILSILHGGRLPPRKAPARDSFRTVAFMTAYNEEDIIFASVTQLIKSGIEVYLIDNWSDDNTVAAIEPLLGKGVIGIERFPADGCTGTYDWSLLLGRIEELSLSIPADWFIHHDVDEIRESPWPELRLSEALEYVDRMGYNAVDHTVIDFRPIDNNFLSGENFKDHFHHFEFGHRPGHFKQMKAWKNLNRTINLIDSGGHEAQFKGRKVFPYKFLLRHYPVRSQCHGEKKVLNERKPRFNPNERQLRGWHSHYDHIKDNHNFVYDQQSLNYFDSDYFYQEYLVERISGIGILRQEKLNLAKPVSKGFFFRLKLLFGLT